MRDDRHVRCGPHGLLHVRTARAPNGVLVLALSGELDACSEHDLRAEIGRAEEQEPPGIVLDLEGLSFVDLTLARVVVSMTCAAERGAYRLALLPGGGAPARLLALTGLRCAGEDPYALFSGSLLRRRAV
jgi:anti-anti-sigma factor